MLKIKFNPFILRYLFSSKNRGLCKSCKRYGTKATCPPYIESMDYYKKLLPTYKNGLLIIGKYLIDNNRNWVALGKTSSQDILEVLWKERETLINNGKFPIIFGAGSCKICIDNCSAICKHPDKSAIPIEATGINVLALAEIVANIIIEFPVKETFYRVGMLLWD